MKKLLSVLSLVFLFIPNDSKAQKLVSDPALTALVAGQTAIDNSNYNKMIEAQKKITQAQEAVALATERLRSAHDKYRKGLAEVSGSVRNLYQIKDIADLAVKIYSDLDDMNQASDGNPLLIAFTYKQQQVIIKRIPILTAQVTQAITGGDLNLMKASDRWQFLNIIYREMSIIRGQTLRSVSVVKRVKQQGIINALNPFSNFIQKDKQIATKILTDLERLL